MDKILAILEDHEKRLAALEALQPQQPAEGADTATKSDYVAALYAFRPKRLFRLLESGLR